MTQTQKVKASKVIIDAINQLQDGEHIVVTYGTDYNNEPVRYRVNKRVHTYLDKVSETISINRDDVFGALDGMNIEEGSLGPTSMKGYTFDMMRQKTTYKFPLYEMTLIETPGKDEPDGFEF